MRKPQEKSRFAVPVAVAVAAHAFLFFGFVSPRVVTKPTPERKVPVPDDKKIEVVVDLAKPEPGPNDPEPTPPPKSSAAPTQPDFISDVVSTSAMTVPLEPTRTGLIPVDTNLIPGGPLGVENIPGNDVGPVSIFHRGDLDNVPRVTFQARPNYPFTLRSSGVSGEVVVDFLVDEQGRVTDVRVVRSTDREFEPPTVAAVGKWRFEPGKRNGRPVRFRMSQAVSFAVGE